MAAGVPSEWNSLASGLNARRNSISLGEEEQRASGLQL